MKFLKYLYEVFKKSVVKVEAKKTVNPYNLNDILNRFDKQSLQGSQH